VVRAPGHLRLHLSQLDEEPRRAARHVRRPPGDRHLHTWSELTPCNTHFRVLADHVRHGVLDAGGFPLEFPVMSLGETLMRPTAMLYRNLASMDVEESIRANPLDAWSFSPAATRLRPLRFMGACSVDLPTILVSGGPMLSGKYPRQRHRLGDQHLVDVGGSACRQDHARGVPRGRVLHAPVARPLHDDGHRVDDGVDDRGARRRHARQRGDSRGGRTEIRPCAHAGRRIVELVKEKVCLSRILAKEAFENAIRVLAAIGGSTNAVIHLTALARRIGVDLDLDDFDRLGRGVHTLVNLMPSGKYLMEDFYYAGGLPAVLRELGENDLLQRDALTVNGITPGDSKKTCIKTGRT